MKYTLDPHQVKTIEHGSRCPYDIWSLDMGLGKTLSAIEYQRLTGMNTLVIAPGYLVPNWEEEIVKWRGDDVIVSPFKKGKELYEVFDSNFAITSYDLIQKAPYLFEWAELVVIDEGHRLKSMKAKRTQFIHKEIFENSIPEVKILTGTPIKNRVEEYYSLLSLCEYDPKIKHSKFLEKFPDSITFADHFSYRREYVIDINGKLVKIVKWDGYRNVDELKEYLEPHYIRFNSEDILELPAPRFKNIQISDIDDLELKRQFDAYFGDGEEKSSVKSQYKAQAALKKAPFSIKYAKDLAEEVKCLSVYTDHVEACEAIAQGLGVEPITGKMAPKRRKEKERQFQSGEIDFIVATFESFSEGISLTRSSNMILNDFPWVPGTLGQTYKRIIRRDQKKLCTFHKILGSPQDLYITETINEKLETIKKVV